MKTKEFANGVDAISEAVEITKRTYYRWLVDIPEFRAIVRESLAFGIKTPYARTADLVAFKKARDARKAGR